MTTPQVLTEEEYLTLNGAGAYLDVCLHEPGWGGRSEAHKRAIKKHDAHRWQENHEKRLKLRAEYKEKVAAGEIRPPTNIELLIKNAQGNEDNESTHAARRALRKRGIDHQQR